MKFSGSIFLRYVVAALGIFLVVPSLSHAQQNLSRPPFTTPLSNITPLAFGMSAEDTSVALGSPLTYVDGPPGGEIFLVLRNVGGSGFLFRNDPLYLQFRAGRLTGWKGYWDQRSLLR